MSTTTVSIAESAAAIGEEARELCALGPALSAARLEEGIRSMRLSLATLEALQRKLEGSERDPRLLIGLERSSLGYWPK